MRGRSPAIATLIIEAIDAVIMIVALVVYYLALWGVADFMAGMMRGELAGLLIGVPGFDYSVDPGGESGNELFVLYEQLRWASLVALAAVMSVCVAARVLASRGGGPGGRMWDDKAREAVVAIVIISAFPLFWDPMADLMESASSFVMNPLYSFDPANPCPADWDEQRILDEYNGSPYSKAWLPEFDVSRAEDVCRPEFRMNYVIRQVHERPTYAVEDADPYQFFLTLIGQFSTGIIGNAFLGIVQSTVTIMVSLLSFLTAIVADLVTAMVAAGLPILLALRTVPLFREPAEMWLRMLPALYMLPLLTAVVVFVGSSVVASAGSSALAGESVGGIDMATVYVWVAALSVLFFSVALPVVLVPVIGRTVGIVTQIVASAVSTAAIMASAGLGARGQAGRAESEEQDGDDDEDPFAVSEPEES